MTKDEKIADDAPFEIPPFDEKDFIRKELISFRTTLFLFGFSVAVALLTYVLWRLQPDLRFAVHLAIAIGLGAGLLRVLFRLAKVDISHWGRKEWFGQFVLYFVFWLGFFLLLTNPPITDAAPPRLEVVASPAVQSPGQPVAFGAFISDNVGVDLDSLRFCVASFPAGTSAPTAYANLTAAQQADCAARWQRSETAPFWQYELVPTSNGTLAWFVQAEDKGGQRAERAGRVSVGDPFEFVDPPRDARFVRHDDSFTVRIRSELVPNVRAVQYSLDAGATWYNFRQHPDAEKAKEGSWTTDPSFQGWSAGPQRVWLRVVEHPYFLRAAENRLAGGIAADPDGPYSVTVASELQRVGEVEPPTFDERSFVPPGQTPGFQVPSLLAGVATLAVLGRRNHHA